MQCRSQNVRQTLAASLHEIAKMLGGGKLVELELVPVFEEMIQDVELVQMGVIKYLAEFLKMLSEPCRVSYLPLLHDILHSTNPFNWRLRQSLSVQLPDLLSLPPPQSVYVTLFPLVMTLLQDPVASVRRDCFKGVAKMVSLLFEQSKEGGISVTHFDAVVRSVNSLARGEAYHSRQLWAELCYRLLRELSRDLFEKFFIDGLLALSMDPVSNVRVAVAVVLGGWESDRPPENPDSPWHWLSARPDIKECVSRLKSDDHDVYVHVVKLQHIYPDITFSSISVKGRKDAPGGSAPVVNYLTGRAAGETLCSLQSDDDSAHDSIDLSISSSLGSPNAKAFKVNNSMPSVSPDRDEAFFGPGVGRSLSSSPPLDEGLALMQHGLDNHRDADEGDGLKDNVLPGPDGPINMGVCPVLDGDLGGASIAESGNAV